MVHKTSQANKQDIRNKVTTKSRTVKQAPTVAKTHRAAAAPQAPRGAMGRVPGRRDVRTSLCHGDASSTGQTIRVLPGHRSLPLPPSNRSLCPKTGREVCKAMPETGSVGIISSPFSRHRSPCHHTLFLPTQSHLFPPVYLYPLIILNAIWLSPSLFRFHLLFQSSPCHQAPLFFQGDTMFLG